MKQTENKWLNLAFLTYFHDVLSGFPFTKYSKMLQKLKKEQNIIFMRNLVYQTPWGNNQRLDV